MHFGRHSIGLTLAALLGVCLPLGFGALAGGSARAAGHVPDVATFSIVGFDADTGDLGIAVESKFFSVGSVVPWARAGVGAIATQAFANTTFGPRGLDLLENGLTVHETLDLLLATDAGRASRQVGIVDAQGESAAFTGDEAQSWAGQRTGPGYAIQGNILAGEAVVEAMEHAFLAASGDLAGRLLTAIEAGQAAGGDARGRQSAALLVVREDGGYAGFNDRYCDLRVDDHPQPIVELRRLYQLWRPNALILEGYELVEGERFEEAIARGREAIELAPERGDAYYHTACYLSRAGRPDEALASLRQAIERDGSLATSAATDPDLEPLRDRAAFQRLIGDAASGH